MPAASHRNQIERRQIGQVLPAMQSRQRAPSTSRNNREVQLIDVEVQKVKFVGAAASILTKALILSAY